MTAGIRTSGRASRVVNDVLRATCEELDARGYADLTVEAVAARAGVNKTTIYRRWPTKSELIASAITQYFDQSQDFPDTGALSSDLKQYVKLVTERIRNPLSRGVIVTLNQGVDPALAPLAMALDARACEGRADIIRRAVERGELPPGTDCALVGELFFASLFKKLITPGEKLSRRDIDTVIDIVIAGAKAVALPETAKRRVKASENT